MSEQIIFPNHQKNDYFTLDNEKVKSEVNSLNTLANSHETRITNLEALAGIGSNIDDDSVLIDSSNFDSNNLNDLVEEIADYISVPYPPNTQPGDTFTLYCNSVSGDNANDGLTSGTAVEDLFVAINQKLRAYRLDGVHVVFDLFGDFPVKSFSYEFNGQLTITTNTAQAQFTYFTTGRAASVTFRGSTPTNPKATRLISGPSFVPAVSMRGISSNLDGVPIFFEDLAFERPLTLDNGNSIQFQDGIDVELKNVVLVNMAIGLFNGSKLKPNVNFANPGRSIVIEGDILGDFLVLDKSEFISNINPDFYVDTINPPTARDFVRARDSIVGNINQVTNAASLTLTGSIVDFQRTTGQVDIFGLTAPLPNDLDDLSILNGSNYDGTGTFYLSSANTTEEALNTLDGELNALSATVNELVPTNKIIISSGSVSVYISQGLGDDESADPENILTPLASVTAAKSYVAGKYLFSGNNTTLNFFFNEDYNFNGEEAILDAGDFINGNCRFVFSSSNSGTPRAVTNVSITQEAVFRNFLGTLEFDSIEWDCGLRIQDCHFVTFAGDDTFDQEVNIENVEFANWFGNSIFNADLFIRDSRRVSISNSPVFNTFAKLRINSCQEVDLTQMVMNQNENIVAVQVSNCFEVSIDSLTLSNEILNRNSAPPIFELDGISDLQMSGTYIFNATSFNLSRTLFQISNSVIAGICTWARGAGVTSTINVLSDIDVCVLKGVSSSANWTTSTPVMFSGTSGVSSFILLEAGSSWTSGVTLQTIDDEFWEGFGDPVTYDDTSSFIGNDYDSPEAQTLNVSNLRDATGILIDRTTDLLGWTSVTTTALGTYSILQNTTSHLEIELSDAGTKLVDFGNVFEDDRIFFIKNSPDSFGNLSIAGTTITPGQVAHVKVFHDPNQTRLFSIYQTVGTERQSLTTTLTNGATVTLGTVNPIDVTSAAATINVPATANLVAGVSWFGIVDALGNSTLNNIVVDFISQTQNFHGSSSNFLLDTDLAHARFVYVNSTIGWVLS